MKNGVSSAGDRDCTEHSVLFIVWAGGKEERHRQFLPMMVVDGPRPFPFLMTSVVIIAVMIASAMCRVGRAGSDER